MSHKWLLLLSMFLALLLLPLLCIPCGGCGVNAKFMHAHYMICASLHTHMAVVFVFGASQLCAISGTASLQQRHQHRHHHRYRIGPRVHVELGEDPAELVCPHCDLIVVTEVSSEAGFMAFFLSAVLCLIGYSPERERVH